MKREILCASCGTKLRPMHPEDVQMGWQRRRVNLIVQKPEDHGVTINGVFKELPYIVCDHCGNPIANGAPVVAVTMWRPHEQPGNWEADYSYLNQ